MTQRASYTSGLFFGALSFASMLVLGLGSSIVLARVYGVEIIGEYAILLGAMMVVNLLSTLREQEAMIRDIARFDRRDPAITGRFYATLAFSVSMTIVAAALVSVAVWFLLPSGAIDRPGLVWPAIAMVLGYAFLDKIGWNLDILMSAFRAGPELLWSRLVQAITLIAVAIPLGMMVERSIWGLLIATVLAWALALAVRVYYVRRFLKLWVSRAELREGAEALPGYLRFGVKAGGGSFATTLSDTAPVWILAPLAPIAVVGAWSRVELLTARLVDGLWRVSEMLFPTLVERREGGDTEGYERVLVDTVRYVVAGTLLVAATIGGASNGVMAVFGPGFDVAAGALAVMMLAGPLQGISAVQQLTLYSVDRPLATTVAAFVRMGLIIGLGIVFVLAWGVIGIAIAVVVSLAVGTLIQGRQIAPELSGPITRFWPRRSLIATLLAYGAAFATAFLIDRWSDNHWITLAALIVGTVVFLAVFVAAGAALPRDRERIVRAREKFAGRGAATEGPDGMSEPPPDLGPSEATPDAERATLKT